MIGTQLDRYRLIEELGSGGMAVVYKGLDLSLGRDVAVKVLHPHLAGKEESRRRFSREARAVARLQHPNIVEIYDFSGDEESQSFIVTEYVRGRTLRVFGDEVGFGLPEIGVLVVERLAAALEHAHAAGVVHRDLKPENVMVRDDGALKLMDFGIARMIGQDERMTMTGAMVGSPLHMAPEVIEGREAGERADIFSLGTILFWLVTGHMAFQGNNTTQTLRMILEGEYPDPRRFAPAASDELVAVIARCLQRDPDARFPSMAALREALTAILEADGVEAGEEALRSFFVDPEGFRKTLHQQIVERLVARGKEALDERRPALALGFFNRVLALEPDEPRVKALLEGMRRRQVIRRRLLRSSLAAGLLVAVGASAWGLAGWLPAFMDRRAASPEAGDELALPTPDAPRDGGAAPQGPDSPSDDVIDRITHRGASDAAEPESPGEIAAAIGASGVDRKPVARRPAESANTRGTGPAASPGSGTPPPPIPAELVPLQLRWVPQGAVLFIDGVRKDTVAPSWSGSLAQGRHVITLSHDECCEPLEETIVLRAGDEPLQRSLVLAPRESGWFLVEANEPQAEVWLDGTFKGTVEDVNRRGGVAVGFSKDDTGRERYVKTVQFELFSPRGIEPRHRVVAEVDVRAGQRSRTQRLRLPSPRAADPQGTLSRDGTSP